jgi:hypothetical protein
MANKKHYVNEEGTVLTFDCGVDVSDGSPNGLEIEMKNPAGTETTLTGTLTGTNSIAYTLLGTEFLISGVYAFQTHVTTGNGEWFGETTEIYVYGEFE